MVGSAPKGNFTQKRSPGSIRILGFELVPRFGSERLPFRYFALKLIGHRVARQRYEENPASGFNDAHGAGGFHALPPKDLFRQGYFAAWTQN